MEEGIESGFILGCIGHGGVRLALFGIAIEGEDDLSRDDVVFGLVFELGGKEHPAIGTPAIDDGLIGSRMRMGEDGLHPFGGTFVDEASAGGINAVTTPPTGSVVEAELGVRELAHAPRAGVIDGRGTGVECGFVGCLGLKNHAATERELFERSLGAVRPANRFEGMGTWREVGDLVGVIEPVFDGGCTVGTPCDDFAVEEKNESLIGRDIKT